MQPYEGIEPAKATTQGIAQAGRDIGTAGQGLADWISGISRNRATIRMHAKQMAHEASLQQRQHEANLQLIDGAHRASMSLDQAKYAQMDKVMSHAEKVQKTGYKRGQNIDAAYDVSSGSVRVKSSDRSRDGMAYSAADKISKANKKAAKKQAKAAKNAAVADMLAQPKAAAIEGKSTGTWGGYGQEKASPSARTGTQNPKFMIETGEVQAARRQAEAPAVAPAKKAAAPKKRQPSLKGIKDSKGRIRVASSGVVGEKEGTLDPAEHARQITNRAAFAAADKAKKAARKRNL